MKIDSVTVRGFRSLKDVVLEVDDYGVFIGANGSGKSSVLYALDWFFGNRVLVDSDVSGYSEESPLADGSLVEVSVIFVGLTAKDRERLQQYGRGPKAVLRRTWRSSTGQPVIKYVGNAKQGPGFAEVRAMTRAPEYRPAYAKLRESFGSLPDLGGSPSKDEIAAALTDWESQLVNESSLIEIADDDATHMFGINGGNVLRDCVRMVLVPAAIDMSTHVGETSSKGSALSELIGAVMTDASAKAQAEWLTKNETVINELKDNIRESVEASTNMQARRINARLESLVPNASVTLTPSVPEWKPKADPTVSTAVTIDGITNDLGRQGHGVQRAVMIAMLQALAPDEDLAKGAIVPNDEDDEQSLDARIAKEIEGLPALLIAIEEPEIYQHPARARSFARTLTALSTQPNVQVFLATHSPFFIRPEQFNSLRRFTLENGETQTASATVAAIAATTGISANKLEGTIERTVPTHFSEGFFADRVVLVEGPTDRVILEAVASRLGKDLDARGISVLNDSGKESLHATFEILTALGIPTYIVVDGDFNSASRKYPSDPGLSGQAHATHKSATEGVIRWLPASAARVGTVPASFGATTVAEKYAVWTDDIEEELVAWPSFVAAAAPLGLAVQDRNNKKVMLYRQAVLAADSSDIPVNLQELVQAICDF